jgi:hypothetical protein
MKSFERLLVERALQFSNLGLQRGQSEAGTTSSPASAAVNPPWAARRRHVNNWFGAMPYWRATKLTYSRRVGFLDDPFPLGRATSALRALQNLRSGGWSMMQMQIPAQSFRGPFHPACFWFTM